MKLDCVVPNKAVSEFKQLEGYTSQRITKVIQFTICGYLLTTGAAI